MIKKFEEFIKESNEMEGVNPEELEQGTEDIVYDESAMPSEFTGDPKTDPYIAAVIHTRIEEFDKLKLNVEFRDSGGTLFNPYEKAQVEGNKYNDIWKTLVNWIKTKEGFKNATVLEKDKILVATFKRVVDKQKSLVSLDDIKRDGWKVFNYNRCMKKWENLVKFSKKVYPDKRDEFKRSQLVRTKYEEFITQEGIYKYAKSWIPRFSKTFPVK